MAANQVQIRRDSNTNLVAVVPADGELGYDTTNKRITIGDGAKSGGAPIPSYRDLQGQVFTAATSTGSANAYTLTLPTQVQPSAYATHQEFAFIANHTNTGAATLTVAALTAKNIKKVVNGSLTDVIAGDITSGRPYKLLYDGTQFVLMNYAGDDIADANVSGSLYEEQGAAVDSANQSVTTTPTKVLEFYVPRTGTYTTRVKASAASSGNHSLLIYIDGGAAGTPRNATGGVAASWDEDLALTRGELIQLYAWAGTGTVDIGPARLELYSSNPYLFSILDGY